MTHQLLMIEDDNRLANMVSEYLGQSGFAVSHAGDGQGGLARLQDASGHALPDLVILDLMLPGQSGLEILAGLRGDPATAALPVLMLSAKGQARDREAAERAGANAFMSKPFSNAERLAQVRAMVGA